MFPLKNLATQYADIISRRILGQHFREGGCRDLSGEGITRGSVGQRNSAALQVRTGMFAWWSGYVCDGLLSCSACGGLGQRTREKRDRTYRRHNGLDPTRAEVQRNRNTVIVAMLLNVRGACITSADWYTDSRIIRDLSWDYRIMSRDTTRRVVLCDQACS